MCILIRGLVLCRLLFTFVTINVPVSVPGCTAEFAFAPALTTRRLRAARLSEAAAPGDRRIAR